MSGGNGQNALGGGLYSNGGTIDFTGCTFTDNKALGGNGGNGDIDPGRSYSVCGAGGAGLGGGLFTGAGTVTLTQSSFTSNSAQGGNGGAGGSANELDNDGTLGGAGGGGVGGMGVVYLAQQKQPVQRVV